MKNPEYEGINILDLLVKPFMKKSKTTRTVVGIAVLLIIVLPFFSVSNWAEALIAAVGFLLLVGFSCMKGKLGHLLWCTWSIILCINLVATYVTGQSFGGYFSNDSMQQRKEEKFYHEFADALYELSVADYEDALKTFKHMGRIVPREFLLEYYLWYIETATYAQNNKLADELIAIAENKIEDYSIGERDVLFKLLPVGKMINLLNADDLDSLREIAYQYRNTNEQIFCAFELASLCLQEDGLIDNNRIRELIEEYAQMNDNYKDMLNVKLELLSFSAAALAEECPEYAVILLAQIYHENKSFFYEQFLFNYPSQYNFMNMRWFSLGYLRIMKDIYKEGWYLLKEDSEYELYKYLDSVEELGFYLGVQELLEEKLEIQNPGWEGESGRMDWELFNIVPTGESDFLLIWLEPITSDKYDLSDLVSTAHFYLLSLEENTIRESQLMIDDAPFCKDITMNKLFLVEQTGAEGKFLIESIEGTGEYLYLDVLDINKGTNKAIADGMKLYHTSDFQFDGNDGYTAEFEIYNGIDANMATKVGGRTLAKINYSQNTVEHEISYYDPAIEFYVEQRNDALILPLENLDNLNGKKIKNPRLLEKIRSNSIPYYRYSLIQQSYKFFLEMADCRLSGVTITYDAGTDQEASFFYFVRKDGENVNLLGIYEIADGKLKSVY